MEISGNALAIVLVLLVEGGGAIIWINKLAGKVLSKQDTICNNIRKILEAEEAGNVLLGEIHSDNKLMLNHLQDIKSTTGRTHTRVVEMSRPGGKGN